MIDKILSKTGVGLALLFMVAELSYINTISLTYMFNGESRLDTVFGIIGAIAFSTVTVLVMRLGRRNWLKIVFPAFDIALVFCGFNLEHAGDLLANPVRFAMSVFLSLFAGLITYSLGQINAEQHNAGEEQGKLRLLESKIAELESKLAQKESGRVLIESNYKKVASELNVTSGNLKVYQSKVDELKSINLSLENKNKTLQSQLDETLNKLSGLQSDLKEATDTAVKYKSAALAAEVARIRKKAEKNRTDEEKRLLEEAA